LKRHNLGSIVGLTWSANFQVDRQNLRFVQLRVNTTYGIANQI